MACVLKSRFARRRMAKRKYQNLRNTSAHSSSMLFKPKFKTDAVLYTYIYTHASEYIVTSCNVCGSISFRTSADDAPFSKTKISCYFKLGFTRDLDIASTTFELWLRNPSSTEAGRRNIGKNSFLPRATRTSHNLSLLSHTQSNKQWNANPWHVERNNIKKINQKCHTHLCINKYIFIYIYKHKHWSPPPAPPHSIISRSPY